MIKYFYLLATTLFSSTLFAQTNCLTLPKTKNTTTLVTPTGTTAQANAIKCGKIIVTLDTAIKVAPKYAYLSIDFSNINGSSQIEILSGNNIFEVFDKNCKPVIIKEKFLKKINGSMESNIVNMLAKIPFKLKNDKDIYTVHYRWESKDKSKNIDVITKM